MKKYLASLLLLSSSSVLQALPLEEYYVNEENNTVVGDGVEWLQWDETQGLSVAEALAMYEGQGYRLASEADIVTLFRDFRMGSFEFDENRYRQINAVSRNIDDATNNYYLFSQYFGVNSQREIGSIFRATRGDALVVDGFVQSTALYGDDGDNDGLYNIAVVRDDYEFELLDGSNSYSYLAYARMTHDWVSPDSVFSDMGVALIRDIQEAPVVVTFGGDAAAYEEIAHRVEVDADSAELSLLSTDTSSNLFVFVYDSDGNVLAQDYSGANPITLEIDTSFAAGPTPVDIVIYNNSEATTPYTLDVTYLSGGNPSPTPTPPGPLVLPELSEEFVVTQHEGSLSVYEELPLTINATNASEILIDVAHDGDAGAVILFLYDATGAVLIFQPGTSQLESAQFTGEGLSGEYTAVIYNSSNEALQVNARIAVR